MKLSMAYRRKILDSIFLFTKSMNSFANKDIEIYESEANRQADTKFNIEPIIVERLQEAINYSEELHKNWEKIEIEILGGNGTQIIDRLFNIINLQHGTLLALRWIALENCVKPPLKKEYKRILGKEESNKEKSMATWEAIICALKKYAENEKNKTKEYTICGIAQGIHRDVATTSNTVIRYFKNYLGKDITRKKYHLPELIIMCDSR